MTQDRPASDRRAQHVAILGCLLHVIGAILAGLLSMWGEGSDLLSALARFLLVGLPIWLVLFLMLNQIRRVGQEALETEELQRARAAGTNQAIFELDDEALLIEQIRLQWMVKKMLPITTVVLSVVLLGGQFLGWGWSLGSAFAADGLARAPEPTILMWFSVGLGFLFYLYARYALAVARLPQWGLIRAGAVCMAGSALACLLVAGSLMATSSFDWAEPLGAYVLRIALAALGLEFALNFVFDLYRPRSPGEVPRPSFDSRILGMIGEPGGFTKSIADAMNYQFGFQISSTWFYQLLQRWLFPIVLTACLVVLLLTSVVIVAPDEQAIVERFGRVSGSVWGPGVHLKLPYPIEIVQRVAVRRIGELVIGESEHDHGDEDGDGNDHSEAAVLWTEEHEFVAEAMLLVAAPRTGMDAASAPTGGGDDVAVEGTKSDVVSLLKIAVPIEYRVTDINKFLYKYREPEKLMQVIAYQHLCDYASSVDIDVLMGPGRQAFNRTFKQLIQRRYDERDLGVEVVFAGIRGAHPPAQSGVAQTFQTVVASEIGRSAAIHSARGRARSKLTAVAGTEARALALDEAILAREAVPEDDPRREQLQQRIQELVMGDPAAGLAPASGMVAALIAEANAHASEQISEAAGKAFTFETQLAAYRAAPELYIARKGLEPFIGLEDVRKYLIIGDGSNVIVDYDVSHTAGLDQVLDQGVEAERAKQRP